MTGVTILNTFDIYDISNLQLFIGFVPYILAVVISIVTLYKAIKKSSSGEFNKLPS